MTEFLLDEARFRALADLYGGDLRRWPEEEREPARGLLVLKPALHQVLTEAADLDDWLDAYDAPAPSHALRERILAAAPRPRAGWMRWLTGAGVGLGLAASCAAGLAVGGTIGEASGLDAGAAAVLAQATASDAGGLFDEAEDIS